MSAQEIKVPDIGDFSDVPVIEIHVAAGDTVAAEDPLVTLESDKATLDVPAPVAGTITELRVAIGDAVSEGTAIMVIDAGGGGAARAKETVTETAAASTATTNGAAGAGAVPERAQAPAGYGSSAAPPTPARSGAAPPVPQP